MGKIIPLDEVLKRLDLLNKKYITIDTTTYCGVKSKARFIDEEYGEWWTIVRDVLDGSSQHPERSYEQRRMDKRTDIKKIKKMLKDVHGDTVIIDESTYVCAGKKAKFIDCDYGEWWAQPYSVINNKTGHMSRRNEKRKDTCMERYGVEHTSQCPEIALKILKAHKNSCILKHWKTGEDVMCQAGWERAVVNYFNANKINFRWQCRTFNVIVDGKRRTYRPDFYLYSTKKWIEIKGYRRELAMKKFIYFRNKIKQNAEIWDYNKLKSMNII